MKKNQIRIISVFIIVLAVMAIGIAVLQLKKAPASNTEKLRVVAAENFWGNVAAQIGGDKVEVTSIISEPGADPHLYESSADNAAALAKADVVITNGLGYDDFMDKLLSAARVEGRTVVSAESVLKPNGDNPHLWYDVPRIGEVAAEFEKAFAKKDPTNASVYAANLGMFKKSLQPLLAVIQEIKTRYSGASVVYTEPVPEYLLTAAGLHIETVEGFASAIEEGVEPSPASTAKMNGLFTDHKVQVLLYNSQATSPVTENTKKVANQAGVPVMGVTETIPPSEATYQSWQLSQLNALLRALEGKS